MDVEAGMTDQKDQWIDALVTGGGFMDVGWLYGTRNEKVTRSLKGDARNTLPARRVSTNYWRHANGEDHLARIF